MPFSTILFDLDGTLIDSTESVVLAIQHAFQEQKLAIPSRESIIQVMGIPIEVSFRQFGTQHYSDQEFADLLNVFRGYYHQFSPNHISAFAGIADMLAKLKSQEKRLAIVTSKKSDIAWLNLQSLGLGQFFDVIIGSDCVNGRYKPDPESVFCALRHFNQSVSKDIIVIGDTDTDIKMGKRAEVATCAVLWGAHDRQQLAQSQPDFMVSAVDELGKLLLS